MKLISVAFKNFRSFKNRTEIPLTRITYLIGPNGSGKSSVFRGIEALSGTVTGNRTFDQKNHFDQDWDNQAYLSFTAELSEDERSYMLNKVKERGYATMDFEAKLTFQYVKYEVSFRRGVLHSEDLSLSDKDGKFHVFERYRREGDSYRRSLRHIEYVNLDNMGNRRFKTWPKTNTNKGSVFEVLGPKTRAAIMGFWSPIALVPNTRQSPPVITASEIDTVSYDCADLPNALRTLYNDRKKTRDLERLAGGISSGGIGQVNVHLRERKHVITAGIKGLEKPVDWAMLSSGEQNMIMLAYIRHSADAPIVMIEEPELHLHAKAQKELCRIMCERTDNQMIVETHSPIFANASGDESVVMLVKNNGASGAAPVDASNCDLLRMEMGISYADALDSDCLCYVEGESEHIAIPAFARTMKYDMGFAPWTWNLGGYGNTKNIRVFLEYLNRSGRRVFLLLDHNSEARTLVDDLVRDDLIGENQTHFLERNFEDLFPSELLVDCTRRLARQKGVEFTATPQDLDVGRKDKSVVDALEGAWSDPQSTYPKNELARCLADLAENEIPDGVKKVIRTVMGGLGVSPR